MAALFGRAANGIRVVATVYSLGTGNDRALRSSLLRHHPPVDSGPVEQTGERSELLRRESGPDEPGSGLSEANREPVAAPPEQCAGVSRDRRRDSEYDDSEDHRPSSANPR